jgi:TorA maturation chaperone TorD
MTLSKETNYNNLLKGYNMLLNFAGSMITYEPTEEMIKDFWNKGILKRLPVSSHNPRFIYASSILRESCDEKNLCIIKMNDDYKRLFYRSATSLAPPYESIYKNSYYLQSGKKPLDVKDFYNNYGLKSKLKDSIPDDHLGTELLFLTLLIDKYLTYDDKFCKTEMKSEIRRFLQQHILSWVEEWNEKVQIHSQTKCYKGIGTLIYACVEDVYQILE